MGAKISEFRLLFYKFVPINFLDAKNGPKAIKPDFSFLRLHRKVMIIYVFFYLKVVP